MNRSSQSSFKFAVLSALLVLLVFVACKEDNPSDPGNGNDQELITKVILTLTENGTSNTVTATFNDPDGDGGIAPLIGALVLKAGSAYTGKIELKDESKNPVADLTEEDVTAFLLAEIPRLLVRS